MKKISVITGTYNEEAIVRDVYEAIKKVFTESAKDYDYEHIFMDNCSTDTTVAILKEIARQDKRVKILVYSKNFGPIKSEMVGYGHASGDAVVVFDANLKDPAELIPEFIKYWENNYEVVYGIRTKTADNFLLSFLRRLYYKLINIFSGEKLPQNVGSFRLVDRKVVNELIKLDDFKPYTRGLITSIGFKQIGIEYQRRPRPNSCACRGYLSILNLLGNSAFFLGGNW